MKMLFAKAVKYNGSFYSSNTAIEVLDKDVEDLKQAGGWVIEEETQEDGVNEINDKEETQEDDDLDTLEELKTKAESLGIKVKKTWGVKKLTEVIEETQKNL